MNTLPPGPCFNREHAILTAVVAGEHEPIVWAPLRSGLVTIWVAEDALKIGGVRVTVTHRTAQQIADHFDARLPTSLISDLTWQKATVRIAAMPQPWWQDGSMSLTRRMIEHSGMVDRAINGRVGLVADVGKDWILTSKLTPDKACNYGWRAASGQKAQPLGLAHNLEHTDYSQSLRLVCRACELDGARVPLDDLLVSREWAYLVSTEGPLPFVRHPGVPFVAPAAPLEDP